VNYFSTSQTILSSQLRKLQFFKLHVTVEQVGGHNQPGRQQLTVCNSLPGQAGHHGQTSRFPIAALAHRRAAVPTWSCWQPPLVVPHGRHNVVLSCLWPACHERHRPEKPPSWCDNIVYDVRHTLQHTYNLVGPYGFYRASYIYFVLITKGYQAISTVLVFEFAMSLGRGLYWSKRQ
jgi:hypothetical protein